MHYVERISKYIALLKECAVIRSLPVEGVRFKKCGYKSGSELPAVDESFKPFGGDSYWGGECDSHAWFAFRVDLPRQKGIYRLRVNTNLNGWDAVNPQLMAYVDGKLVQGLDTNHTYFYLERDCDVMLYAYSGAKIDAKLNLFVKIEEVSENADRLATDIEIPYIALSYLDKESKEYADILSALNHAIDLVDFREIHSAEYEASLIKASEFLREEFYEKGGATARVKMLGHTHIDIAWLWTLDQTREKVQRSFATVLELMRRYPEFKFFSSQPVLYKMLKEECPYLYEELKARVKEGRWEPDGAMWVEADCNLSSGESLVRQIIFGKRFFKEEFGKDSRILWLPDVFGYSAALPQILKKSGVDYFVTAKITWNDTNRVPHDAFRWKGIDGTEILTYFITTQDCSRGATQTGCTYVGFAEPKQVAGTWKRFSEKDKTDEVLMPYGWGDGGGGPSREFIENIRRMRYGFAGCPKAEIGTAEEFLNRFSETAAKDKKFPKWSGELYLEFHRGTYTSAANNKKNNRRSECLLECAEWLSVLGGVALGTAYPKEMLERNWEVVLHNQFHDILPGSSIREVYERSDKEYAALFAEVGAAADAALENIASSVETCGGYVVFNPHSFANSGYVETENGLLYAENVPPKGYAVVRQSPASDLKAPCVSEKTLSNAFFKLTFDENYNVVSLIDKRCGREVLSAPAGLRAYEDYPYDYDAWELSDYYRDKCWGAGDVENAEILQEQEKCGIKITRKFGKSTICETISLYRRIARIDYDYDILWNSEHIMLKSEFPVDINADYATYDIQFGAARRSATMNTSWDEAMFEVCAHKFADFSEYGYGVSLMSDCKYGYSVKNGVMSISLLKCATNPNPDSDKGRHTFRCSLMPHIGDYQKAGVLQAAYDLNIPMRAIYKEKQNGALPAQYSLLGIKESGVIAETVKQAEGGEDIVVRAYEAFGMRCNSHFTLGFDAEKVCMVNLLEEDEREIPLVGKRHFEVAFRPFEIVTFKITKIK